MRLKRNTKRGSYLVEAVIVIPIFIMSVLLLISIIPIVSTCENITYSLADELRFEDAKSAFRKNAIEYPITSKHRIKEENNNIYNYRTNFFHYLYSENNIDDLISADFTAVFKEKNPFGLFSCVNFNGRIMSRAYTGTYQKIDPNSGDEDSKIVYIFPNWGERYHNKSCTYVKSNCQMIFLSQQVERKFSPCKLCDAKSAPLGTPVFCFMFSGHVYHHSNCKIVDKYYVEIEKKQALEKGYTLCSKCGGD